MFGKRSVTSGPSAAPPPPPPGGAEIATRPQRQDTPKPEAPRAEERPKGKAAAEPSGPRATAALEQLKAAQGAQPVQSAVAEIVREQSDYYHATKTTIYTALLNTIDLSQLAQLLACQLECHALFLAIQLPVLDCFCYCLSQENNNGIVYECVQTESFIPRETPTIPKHKCQRFACHVTKM